MVPSKVWEFTTMPSAVLDTLLKSVKFNTRNLEWQLGLHRKRLGYARTYQLLHFTPGEQSVYNFAG
ncbi:hypothetical protein MXB_5387 [Myxobolus squamalis]|nr:hypothetical protein MXB_5387 [Myxobolus squamalis]